MKNLQINWIVILAAIGGILVVCALFWNLPQSSSLHPLTIWKKLGGPNQP